MFSIMIGDYSLTESLGRRIYGPPRYWAVDWDERLVGFVSPINTHRGEVTGFYIVLGLVPLLDLLHLLSSEPRPF